MQTVQATVENISLSACGEVSCVYMRPDTDFVFQEGQFVMMEAL